MLLYFLILSLSPSLQHTASTVLAAAYPAPRILTFHRRGWRQLHQSKWKPGLQSEAQTHAPFLQGNGLWAVSLIYSPTSLFAEETQMVLFFYNKQTDIVSVCAYSILDWKEDGDEQREGGGIKFYSSYLCTRVSWRLTPSVKTGWGRTVDA